MEDKYSRQTCRSLYLHLLDSHKNIDNKSVDIDWWFYSFNETKYCDYINDLSTARTSMS